MVTYPAPSSDLLYIATYRTRGIYYVSRQKVGTDLVFILQSVPEQNKKIFIFNFNVIQHIKTCKSSRIFTLLKGEPGQGRGRVGSAGELMYEDKVGTCEWQFPWPVPRVYFETLSKLS